MKTITKKEVAERAGVSHMTVTRVLNNHSYVTDSARARVMEACLELNYRPNRIASSLRSKKSFAIGVVVPTFRHTFYSRFLDSVEREASVNDYHIITVQTRRQKEKLRNLDWKQLEFLLARQIDGLIMIDSFPSADIIKKLKEEKLPVVFADVPPEDDGFPFVGTADFKGGKIITDYLINKGHKSIAFIGGHAGHYTSEQRLKGCKYSMKENRIPLRDELVLNTDYTTEGGGKAAETLLKSGKRFTAVACANDYIAIGALSAFHSAGVKVPDKVSVAGFTGDEICAFTVPPLTTMVQPIEKIGRKSVEMLLARIEHPERPVERVLIDAELCERESVKGL